VWSKGKAYVFGLFALAPKRVAFSTQDGVLIDERRQDVTFEWPRILAGGGCRLRMPSDSCLIAFGRPYPDAPAPDRELIEGAFDQLEALQETAGEVTDYLGLGGSLLGLGASVVGDLVKLSIAVSDLKKGRRSAEIVKTALAGGGKP
jgi:hypothetical protein